LPWVRIDDEFPHHPKVTTVGPFGVALQVAALCYSNHFLTDGFIPYGAVRTLLDFNRLGENIGDRVEVWVELGGMNIAERLVEAGMWDEVEGGFQIHDYDHYQPSRVEVEAERKKNRDRVAKHRAGRGNKGRNPKGNAASNAITNGDVRGAPVPVPVPPGVTEGDPTAETNGLPTVAASQATRPESQDTIDVFEAWKATLPPGSRPRLTPTRRDAIKAALKRYDRQDVLDAAQGWVNDPWPERAQHNDLAQLLHMGSKRKPKNILEAMRDLQRNGRPVTAGRRTRELAENAHGLRALVERLEGGNADGTPGVGTSRRPAQRELPGPAG
jgi:hypothetical protein